eukprot:4326066-Prymnesium_polylepis.1
MLGGAPHGSSSWEPVAYGSEASEGGLVLRGREMSVSIPFAGTFCAFAKRSASSVVYATRFHIFAAGEVSRSKPSSLHVQLCPDLPDQITAMEFAESSCSGLST